MLQRGCILQRGCTVTRAPRQLPCRAAARLLPLLACCMPSQQQQASRTRAQLSSCFISRFLSQFSLLSSAPRCSTGRLEELKARYVAAGSPHNPDWHKLLEGL